MKTKTDMMDLIRIVCNFYNEYRETLGLSHEDARYKVELMYGDLYNWIYKDELKKEVKSGKNNKHV